MELFGLERRYAALDRPRFTWPESSAALEATAKEQSQLFFQTHGRLPSGKDGRLPTLPTTWGSLSCVLKRRLGRSLADVIGGVQRFVWPADRESTVKLAVKHGAHFKRTHGRYPSGASGSIDGLEGATWSGLENKLRKQFGLSLRQVYGRSGTKERLQQILADVKDFLSLHGRYPLQSGNALEARLATDLRAARRRHKVEVAASGLTAEPNVGRVDRTLQAVAHFCAANGHPPRMGCSVLPAEHKLACAFRHARQHYPEKVLAFHNDPLAHRAATVGEGSLGKVLAMLGRCWRSNKNTCTLEHTSGGAVNHGLRSASLGHFGLGLGREQDLCQVNSLARANFEIEHDCWRFTLKGAKKPDHRPWAAILASGDNKKIEKVQRVAFLDWEHPDENALTLRSASGPKSYATRRPWSPHANKNVA